MINDQHSVFHKVQTAGYIQQHERQIRLSLFFLTNETKMNFYQTDATRNIWRTREMTHDMNQTTSSVKHSGGGVMALAWLPVQPGHYCLLMMCLLIEVAG